jgi:signal transduction histidine kinase/PAS domain-containing protein
MSAEQFAQFLAQVLYVIIFVYVLVEAVRRPLRTNLDIALLFGVMAVAVALGWVEAALRIHPRAALSAFSISLVMILPYLFLRLVDDFAGVPRSLIRGAAIVLVLLLIALFVAPHPYPLEFTVLDVLYFVGLEVYGAVVVVQAAKKSSGVTRRRMQAVALGSVFLGLTILASGPGALYPEVATTWTILGQTCILVSGVGYFLGFAPPSWLRRAWQAPELRAFLSRAPKLTGFTDLEAAVRALEEGAAESIGATGTTIALWDETEQVLRFWPGGKLEGRSLDGTLTGRAFVEQRALLSTDLTRDNPSLADAYREDGASVALIAPITSGKNRFGVLIAYGRRAPVFAESDLELVRVLADQIAVVLENRALVEEATRTRARAEALAAAEAERRRLYAVLMEAPAAICHYRGPDHVVEFANARYLDIAGNCSIVGKPIREARPDLEGQGLFDMLDRVYVTGEPMTVTESHVHVDRRGDGNLEDAYFNFVYQPTRDGEGKIDGILVHGFEVTGQVLARESVERAANRIARLQAVTAGLSERQSPADIARLVVTQAIAVVDANAGAIARIVDGGSTFEVLYEAGYRYDLPADQEVVQTWRRFPVALETPVGKAVHTGESVFLESREDRETHYPHLADVQETINLGASATIPLVVEGRVVGAMHLNFEEARRVSEEDRVFLLALARQCAQALERARLDEAERQARVELEAANKELEAFSYSVAHDLRAPLRAIDGFSRILVEEHAPELSSEAQRYIHVVRSNAQQMGELIDDLLTFSRLSRQPIKKQTVKTAEIVHQVVEELQDAREGRRVDISIGDLPACRADPTLLKLVYLNLLANALKFTRRRDVAVIEIGCREEGDGPIYWVKDNGVGFDMRYAHKLFGVFQRLHRAEEYEGTGVGLAIVQRIVHRHGGRVWAEAEVDRGASFYFTFGGSKDDA